MLPSLFIMLALQTAAEPKAPAYALPHMLVEPADLARERNKYVVVDVRSRKDFLAGHVPDARWIDLAAWSKAMNQEEDRAKWVKRIRSAGIDGTMPVVVVGDTGKVDAARCWWILRYWGIDDVHLLNGGWKAYLSADGRVDIKRERLSFVQMPDLKASSARLAKREDLLTELKAGKAGQIVDARTTAEHCGDKKLAKRGGAIPGARHLDWSDTLEKDGRFKSAAKLTKLFEEAGIDPSRPATTYCQSGGRAAVMAFVLELMSGKPARNYYRSWSEWGNDPDTPITAPKK